MEHKPRVDLQDIADLSPVESRVPMSRDERLARWVEVLERDPKRILRPLHGIEFRKPDERRTIRSDNSPLTVAYEDPVLRSEGLAGDRLGDAVDFFQLTTRRSTLPGQCVGKDRLSFVRKLSGDEDGPAVMISGPCLLNLGQSVQ